MKEYRFGFLGCGHMGMAILKGAIRTGLLKPSEIAVYDPRKEVQEECRKEGAQLVEGEVELSKKSHFVLLGVRPQDCDEVLDKLKDVDMDVLVSIVTGYSISYLQEKLNNTPIIRTMPNTPLQLNCGSTALSYSNNCKEEDLSFILKLFQSMGIARVVEEEYLTTLICAHGSTPAYFYYFLECILEDLKRRGVEEEIAREFLVETMIGSGLLLQKEPTKPLKAFIDEVCSPGGTTIEAITSMRHDQLDKIIEKANEKCLNRAKELGK